jgi:chitosanase
MEDFMVTRRTRKSWIGAMPFAFAGTALALIGCSADAFGPDEPTGQSNEHLDQTAFYQVVNMTSGLCMDDSGNSLVNNNPMIQWGCGDSTKQNQHWQFKLVSGSTTNYNLVNQLSDLCLNNGGSTTSGTGITQWSCGSSVNLQWTLVFKNGWYQIKSAKSGMCLDNTGSDDSGPQFIQKTCSSSSNQMFALDELTTKQQKVTYALTSIWENDDPVLHYEYAENINDGRGYTSGRAGFCTQTGDAIQVIDCYDNRRTDSSNKMSKYYDELVAIDNRHQPDYDVVDHTAGDVSGLNSIGNWVTDWGSSATNSTTKNDFKSCQDQITNKLYLLPALDAGVKWGLTYALTEAELYDAFINHGEDGANAIIASTNSALGAGSRTSNVIGYNGITEDAWLKKFLEKRRDVLYGNGSSTWTDAMDRVAAYEKARRRQNYDLSQPITTDVRARDCWSHSPAYPDSQYTCYKVNADGSASATNGGDACATYSCN